MIEIKLIYHNKILTGIESKGHSGFSKKGQDIICAAVSTIMQALIIGIEKINGSKIIVNEKIPLIKINWPLSECEKLFVLTDTMSESLSIIAKENSSYVKIITEEIN